jgi:hypothetical protein
VGARRWTTAFLTAEFALTTVMLAGLLLSVRLTRAAERAAVVINPAHIITTSVTLPADRYASPHQRAMFYEQLEARLTAIPVLSSVAVTTALAMGAASERHLAIADRPAVPGETPLTAWSITIGPRYFDVLAVPGLRGRPFGEFDGSASHEVAIVNQRFAQLFFPDASESRGGQHTPDGHRRGRVHPPGPTCDGARSGDCAQARIGQRIPTSTRPFIELRCQSAAPVSRPSSFFSRALRSSGTLSFGSHRF